MQQLVMTAVGPDRPGLVEQLSGYLHEAGANIADSRMANLRGQFALIALIEAPDDKVGSIEQGVVQAGSEVGLTVTVVRDKGGAAPATGLPYRLRTFAMDQPGIVHRITHLLHQHRVNIEELQTSLQAASYSGTPLFSMELTMTVPTDVSAKGLREALAQLCDSLNCDFEMTGV